MKDEERKKNTKDEHEKCIIYIPAYTDVET